MIPFLALVTLIFVGAPASALQKTGIPVLLPRTYGASAPDKIYVDVEAVRPGAYTVQFEWTADCHGSEPCYIATAEGGVDEPVSGDRTVRLQNGIAAKFTNFTCGGWCSKPYLMFRYRGTTYRLTMKGRTFAEVVAAANSLFPPR